MIYGIRTANGSLLLKDGKLVTTNCGLDADNLAEEHDAVAILKIKPWRHGLYVFDEIRRKHPTAWRATTR